MGYTAPDREWANRMLREEGPLGPVLPPPPLPSVEEVHAFRVYVGFLTTQTMGEYDIGIQLNGEKGAWILASALSYQEMLEELSQYAGLEPRPMLSKMLATPDLSYYRLPRFDDPMADDHYLLCQKCRTFYNGIRGHPPHQCILLEEPFLTR